MSGLVRSDVDLRRRRRQLPDGPSRMLAAHERGQLRARQCLLTAGNQQLRASGTMRQ